MFLADTNIFLEILLKQNKKVLNLDFDDSYQYTVAKYFDLKIVTMDNDFKRVEDIGVLFL